MTTPPCPSCTAMGLIRREDGSFECRYCGSTYPSDSILCPVCGWLNSGEDDRCTACGEALSVVAHVMQRQGTRAPEWIHRMQGQAHEIKQREERASRHRMQEFLQIDEERERQAAQEEQKRIEDERHWLIIVGTAGMIFFLLLLIAAIVLWR